jgi:hypothetical protein
MQYVRGEELAALVQRERLEIPRAVDLMLSLCAAVQAVHDRNVVHRDLKPENVKVVKEKRGETAMLLDFGVAKVLGSHPIFGANPKLTAADSIVGSVEYMAPEQASGSPHVDFAADQYAIGVILYRCLTQRLPFEGTNALAVMRMIIEGVFDGPRVHRPEIPVELEPVIRRALSRYPEDRFPSVGNLGEALLPFASPRGRRLWMDELTSPNREPQGSGGIGPAARAAVLKVAAAGGTQVLPPPRDPGLPRTQVLPPRADGPRRSQPAPVPRGPSRWSPLIMAAVAGAALIVMALATAAAIRFRGRSGRSPVVDSLPAAGAVTPAPMPTVTTTARPVVVGPSPSPAQPAQPTGRAPVAAQPPGEGRPTTPRPTAMTNPERPARKAASHRSRRPADAPTPLPKETPSHVKLVF